MITNRDRRNGLILPSTVTYGKFNNKKSGRYNLSDVVLNIDNDFNISSDKFSDDEFESGLVQRYSTVGDDENDSFHDLSDIPYAQSHLINVSISDNEQDENSDIMIASPDKLNTKPIQLKQSTKELSTPNRRSALQEVSPLIQNASLTHDIKDKRIPLNNPAPNFQRNSSAGLSHLRKRSSLTSNSSKRWSLLSFNNELDKENTSISNISKRFSINSIPSIQSIHSSSSSKNKRFSISSQQSSSTASTTSFKNAMNKMGNILSSVSVNSSDHSNESTPFKNIQPGVVGEYTTINNKRSSDNANLTPVAFRQSQLNIKNQRTQPQSIPSQNPHLVKIDDDTISLFSTNTTSSLRSSRSRFRLSSIFSSSYKKETDGESIRSLKGKSSFNDIRRSVLRLNKKDSISDLNRSMISLPKPDNDSRLKLNNRLRNSQSFISINSIVSRQPTNPPIPFNPNPISTINDINNIELKELIKLTGHDQIYSFNSYINNILKLSSNELLIKFNEASYSEVFQVKNFQTGKIEKILKIIPFGNDSIDQQSIENVIQELKINHKLNNYPGFIKLNNSFIVEGLYPNFLLKLWDDFNELKGSKNSRPNEFESNQKYLILDLEYGGLDLEKFQINKWNESLEIFWQIVEILSNVEKKLNFEHRDLHWGNIVINRLDDGNNDEIDEIDADISNISIDEDAIISKFTKSKISVKLIDYTLSRLDEEEVIFTSLDHPDFFKGKGDYQFDIYRFMRTEIQKKCENQEINWSMYTPRTNLFWLHYILLKLINSKNLKKRSKDLNFKKLEYLSKCLDPRRKKIDNNKNNYKKGDWNNYYSTDFNDCSDILKLGEVCGLH